MKTPISIDCYHCVPQGDKYKVFPLQNVVSVRGDFQIVASLSTDKYCPFVQLHAVNLKGELPCPNEQQSGFRFCWDTPFYECSICNESIPMYPNSPYVGIFMLKDCHHVMCGRCLKKIAQKVNGLDYLRYLRCPFCRRDHYVSKSDFPKMKRMLGVDIVQDLFHRETYTFYQ